MSQAVKCKPFPYTDNTCLVCQHNDINEFENQLNKNFESIFDWFANNELSIHFGDDKISLYFLELNSKLKRSEN